MKNNLRSTSPITCPGAPTRGARPVRSGTGVSIHRIRLALILPALLLAACLGGDRQPLEARSTPGATPSPEVSTNRAPTITGTPSGTATVGREWSFQPTIKDPDNDRITVTVRNRPDWMSVDAATGRLQGTPGEGDVRTWSNILLEASDGQATASLPWFSVVVSAGGAATGTATLSWNPPTERADGTPIGALAGYRVLYGQVSMEYDTVIAIDNPGITRHMVEGLGAGTWYFAVTAVTVDGLMSAPSQEVSKSF
jgi:hypothetical protein